MALKDTVLIIGAGIGGLSAGALLAKRGWNVIILEQSSRIGGCCGTFSRSGFRFDIGPTLFPDMLWSGLDMVLRELELDIKRIFLDPFFQVCIPGHRISIYRDLEMTEQEWAREFPELKDDIREILRRLRFIDNNTMYKTDKEIWGCTVNYENKHTSSFPLLSFLFRVFISKRLSAHIISTRALKKSLPLKAFDLQTLFWGQTKFNEANLAYAALVSGLPLRGGFQIKGGIGFLCSQLSRYIKEKGGRIRLNSHVKQIMVKNNDAIALRLDSGEELEGRCFIANTTPWALYEKLLPIEPKTEKIIKSISKIPYPKGVFTMFLGLKETCLPSEMGQEVLFLPGIDNENPLFIALNPLEDKDRAPEGYRTMTLFKYTPTAIWPKNKKKYNISKKQKEEKTIQLLKKLIPFIDDGICYYESATPLTYERYTARPGGIVKGVPQVTSVFNKRAFSEFTCYDSLFTVNDCISPGLGVEGVCRASLRLVDLICKRYS